MKKMFVGIVFSAMCGITPFANASTGAMFILNTTQVNAANAEKAKNLQKLTPQEKVAYEKNEENHREIVALGALFLAGGMFFFLSKNK